MIHKEIPLCSWGSAFGHESTELLPACLINLLHQKLWCPLSLCLSPPATFLGLVRDLEGGVFTSLSPAQCPQPTKGLPLPGATILCWFGREETSPSVSQQGVFQLHRGTWKGSGTNLRAFLIRLVRIQVQIQACLRGRRGVLSTLKRHLRSHLFGVKPCLSGSGSWVEVLCCVRVCESESLRHSPVTKQLWSPDLWVPGELIWCRVSPNRTSGPGLKWTYYGK
jgi:hypothetical protein